MDLSNLSSRLTAEEMRGLYKALKHRYVPESFIAGVVILINPDNGTMATAHQKLKQDGLFHVCSFKSVADAVAEFGKVKPMLMPVWVVADETNGFEMLKAKKEVENLKAMRVLIVVQTYDNMDVIQKVYGEGAHGLMTYEYFTY